MASWYSMLGDRLYKRGFSGPLLLCVSKEEAEGILEEPLKSVLSPWPFFMWGVDILGPFPMSSKQVRWIIVAVDYFTKWVEAKPLASISAEQVKKIIGEESYADLDYPNISYQITGLNSQAKRLSNSARKREFRTLSYQLNTHKPMDKLNQPTK
ncbi:hypothetical protein QL285_038915 [Trifolium repens]|nr:hypothetical protein QL285_038915 [Trifolium repens]